MFPTPLAILIFCAPESPWWLVRKGRLEEAAHAVGRLGRRSRLKPDETVAMMRRVVELEASTKEPNHFELFKGTDLYRTLIVCCVYLAQNLTGNLIANQAVYFFERKLSPIPSLFPVFYHVDELYTNTERRGRHGHQHSIRSRSYHLSPPDDLRHAILDPHHLPRTPNNLPLGIRIQRCPASCARRSRLMRKIKRCFPGTSFPGSHHFRSVHSWSCARFLGYHW